MSVHVFNFLFRREIFETRPNCTKVTHSVFTIHFTIFTSHQIHTLDNDLCNIEFVILLFKTIGLIRLIKSEVHQCKPFLFKSPNVIY